MLIDPVPDLQKLDGIISVIKNDVVQRLDADVELKLDVQALQDQEQRVLDLSEVANADGAAE